MMVKDLKELIKELKKENEDRTKRLNDPDLTEYGHTVFIHQYNNTLDIIKRIEAIINKY